MDCYARFVSIDPTRNRARFYTYSVQPMLDGRVALVREWGRIGARRPRMRYTAHPDRRELDRAAAREMSRRESRGYLMTGCG